MITKVFLPITGEAAEVSEEESLLIRENNNGQGYEYTWIITINEQFLNN